jgi:phage protein U
MVLGTGDDSVEFSADGAAMQSLRRSLKWRWVKTQVIGAAPGKSYIGPDDRTRTLQGIVYPGQIGSADVLDKLEALGDTGEPQPLADGDGRAYGRWCIESLDESHTEHLPGGQPRKIAWTITISLFVPRVAS